MQPEQLKSFLEANTTFSFGNATTPYTANDFWGWAFSNMNVAVLRGVLIEYLVAKSLIAKCDHIVGDTVRALTTNTPQEGDLTRSIEKHYQVQPHGDVFDLQLTWGVTLEIKSTASPQNWRLNKTCRWNIMEDKNLWEQVFPAQFYILAHIDSDISFNENDLDLGSVTFHVRTGRELDALTGTNKSVGFSRFVGDETNRPGYRFDELPDVLKKLQAERLESVQKHILPGWKMAPVPGTENYNMLPLAIEGEDGTDTFWCREVKLDKGVWRCIPIDPIPSPWKAGFVPDWRDWEAAGFSYVPRVMTPVESLFRRLLPELDGVFSASEIAEVSSFVEVGEYGLALDTTIGIFIEEKKRAESNVIALVQSLATAMKLPDAEYSELLCAVSRK
ncbi:MafI family immunity protein [Pseudomonas sp. NPDC089734]|uniref:MafI family immunity protein n=1 Tax=Pseudomonas sp. NPDC089734 TaxID=3364469 RepID=UPI00380BFFB1